MGRRPNTCGVPDVGVNATTGVTSEGRAIEIDPRGCVGLTRTAYPASAYMLRPARGKHDLLALTPIIDDSRLQAKVTDLQAQIEELRNLQDTRIKTLQKTITEARQATKTLDEMVKKQANQNKALEARLNRLEQKEPPTYTMSALSKSEKKK